MGEGWRAAMEEHWSTTLFRENPTSFCILREKTKKIVSRKYFSKTKYCLFTADTKNPIFHEMTLRAHKTGCARGIFGQNF
jgi:hypothetical protein